MEQFYIPTGYKSELDIRETQRAIKSVKDHFERQLAKKLNLTRVSAPLFVKPESGLNDNLNGVEEPVSFKVGNNDIEIVHSLAKWKRIALSKYNLRLHSGLYTDMNAIRKDECLDEIHSIYVDQWDWEMVIEEKDRNIDFLKNIVTKIYNVLRETEIYLQNDWSQRNPVCTHLPPGSPSPQTGIVHRDMYSRAI